MHDIKGKGAGAGDPYVLLTQLDASTSDGQVVDLTAGSPWSGVRYLRIETVWGPSWPAWREIQVFEAS